MFDWHAAGIGANPVALLEGEDLRQQIADPNYVKEGLELLRRHYKITATERVSFYEALAFHLMRAHVPYFKPPVRRMGRPGRLQTIFPLIDALQHTKVPAEKAFDLFAERLGVLPETLEREYRRWKKDGGGNSKA